MVALGRANRIRAEGAFWQHRLILILWFGQRPGELSHYFIFFFSILCMLKCDALWLFVCSGCSLKIKLLLLLLLSKLLLRILKNKSLYRSSVLVLHKVILLFFLTVQNNDKSFDHHPYSNRYEWSPATSRSPSRESDLDVCRSAVLCPPDNPRSGSGLPRHGPNQDLGDGKVQATCQLCRDIWCVDVWRGK